MRIALTPLLLWTFPLQLLAIFQPLAYQIIIDQAVSHGGKSTLWVMLSWMAIAWLIESWVQWHRHGLFWTQAALLKNRVPSMTSVSSLTSHEHRQALLALGPWGANTLQALDLGGNVLLLLVLFVLHWPVASLAATVWVLTTLISLHPLTQRHIPLHQLSLLWSSMSRMVQWITLGWVAYETLQGQLSMGSLIAINLMMGRIQGSWPATPAVVQSWRRWNWAQHQEKQV